MNSNPILTKIIIYPIKSLAGILLDKADVKPEGLGQDRTMMLVDDKGNFVTQRRYPKLTLLKVSFTSKGIAVKQPSAEEIQIESKDFTKEKAKVKIWKDFCDVFIGNTKINHWFSRYIGTSVRLVKYDFYNPRSSDITYSNPSDIVSFADGFPLLVISQASLDDLNSRLIEPVTMENFRPNIVVDGVSAYEEDKWHRVKIGEAEFEGVKLCGRCIMTTINPATGMKSQQGEPLNTLRTYRAINGEVCLGMNLVPRKQTQISLQDAVQLIKTES